MHAVLWALGGVSLSLVVGAGVHLAGPTLAPIFILAALAGVLVLWKPEFGVLMLFGVVMFRPDVLQGWSVATMLVLLLVGILGATVALLKRLPFFKVRQVQIFFLIAGLMLVNWLVVGRVEAPTYLAELDLTGRTLQRTFTQLAYLVLFVAFIRTRRHVLLVTLLFLGATVLTIPGAITHTVTAAESGLSPAPLGKVERLRAVATFGVEAAENANRLAFLSLMAITLIWFALLEYRARLLRLAGGLAIIALAFTVLLSGSRSGLLNLALLPILLVFSPGVRWRQISALALVLVLSAGVGLAFVPAPILHRITAFLPGQGEEPTVDSAVDSTERRVSVLRAGLKLVGENPLVGAGIGNFRWRSAVDPLLEGTPMTAHDAYLLTMAEGGVVLLGAYLLLFWQCFRDLGRALALSALAPGVGLRWLVLATRTNLILLLVFSFFADAWNQFYYVLIVATTAVLARLYREAAEESWSRSRSST